MAQASDNRDPLPPAGAAVECDSYIEQKLLRTRQHLHAIELSVALLALGTGSLAYLSLMVLLDHWVMPHGLGFGGRLAALVVFALAAGGYTATCVLPLVLRRVNPLYAAQAIERSRPALKNSLINLLLLRGRSAELPPVVYEGMRHQAATDLTTVSVEGAVDGSRLVKLGYALAVLVVAFCLYKVLSPKDPLRSIVRVIDPWAEVAAPTRVQIDDIQPGDSKQFQQKRVRVSALVEGLMPGESVRIYYSTADGQLRDQSIDMEIPADGYRYVADLPDGTAGLQQDVTYRIVAGDAISPDYHVEALIAPAINVERVEYRYPDYTELPPRVAERQGDIQALEGTEVTIHARATHPIREAWIRFDDGTDSARMSSTSRDASGVIKLGMKNGKPEHSSYKLVFSDKQGHGPADLTPIKYKIEIVPDLPPEVAFVEPQLDAARELTMGENDSLRLALSAADPDFKLAGLSLVFQPERDKAITNQLVSDPRAGRVRTTYVVNPRSLGFKAGDKLQFWAVAEDNKRPVPNRTQTAKYTLRIVSPQQQKKEQDQLAQAKPPEARHPDQPPQAGDGQRDRQNQPGERPQNQPPDESKDGQDKQQPQQQGQPPAGQGQKQEQNDQRVDPDADPGKAIDEINKHFGDDQQKQPPASQQNKQQPAEQEPDQQGDKQQGDQKQPSNQPQESSPSGQGGKSSAKSQQPGDSGQGRSPDQSQSGDQGQESAGGKTGNAHGDAAAPQTDDAHQRKPDENNQGNDDHALGGQRTGQKAASDPQAGGKPGSSDGQQGGQPDATQPNDGQGQTGADQKGEPTGQGQQGGKPQGQQAGQQGGQQGSKQQGGQGQPGAQQPGAQQPAQPPSGGQPNAGEQQGGGAQQGQPQQGAPDKSQQAGQPGGRQQPQQGGKPDASQQPSSGQGGDEQQPGKQPSASQQTPDGKQPLAGDQPGEQSGNQSGQQPGGKAMGNPQAAGNQPGSQDQPGSANQQGGMKPGAGQPDEKNGKQPAGNLPGDNAAAGEDNGQPMGQAGKGDKAGGDQTDQATGNQPSGSQPAGQKDAQGGDPDAGKEKPGAGQPSGDKQGSPAPQESNQSRNKQPDSSGGQQQPMNSGEGNSPSRSPHQSDSKGSTSGDQSGGGQEGGGQKAANPGTGGAGQNTASDEGGGKSNEQGAGETSGKSGNQAQADKPMPGNTGNQPGQGSGQQPGGKQPGGLQQAGNGSGGGAGSSGAKGGAGSRPGGDAQASDTRNNQTAAPEEDPNLDYARKATDLALDRLKHQLQKPGADDLLKKLKWTREDAQRFINRWEAMKRAAREPGQAGREAQAQLDDTLRSLGLRPHGTTAAGDHYRNQRMQKLRSGVRTQPPAEYADQYRAYSTGTSQVRPAESSPPAR